MKNMSNYISFVSKMTALAGKKTTEQIYSYKISRLVRYGSWSLSLVFFTYGLTFADWSLKTSYDIYQENKDINDNEKNKWYLNPTLLLIGRVGGVIGLSIIPFTLSIGALYFPSRIVTKINYIPGNIPSCELITRSIFGRDVLHASPLNLIRRNQKTKIFTGKGAQGVDDNSSFTFFLIDHSQIMWNRLFIVNRSGNFWGQDGRVMDALFGGDSIKDLQKMDLNLKVSVKEDSLGLDRLIKKESKRTKMVDLDAKKIIMKHLK